MDGGCGDESDDDRDSWGAGGKADQPVSKTEVVEFKAQRAKFAAEWTHSDLQEREAKVERLRAYDARVKTALTNRDSPQVTVGALQVKVSGL